MSNVELKPCPFCGGEAKMRHINSQDDWWVSCDKCRVQRPSVQGIVHSKDEAAVAWNQRTLPAINWTPVTERMPDPGKPVLVACAPEGQYTIQYWSRAIWIPRYFHLSEFDDYEGDLDYREDGGDGYWPEGWYEWNNHEDEHWQLPTSVTHWAEVTLPPLEPQP